MDTDEKKRTPIWQYALIIVLVLMVTIVVLALLGPAIGNTFSGFGPNI